ncbi:MAG: histidinol-phosphate transaminase [bacterium]|nr:histidinol-phosphate transaminase [bacterium]
MSHYKPPLEGRASRDYLLLDFNERTTPSSPKVKEALIKFIEAERLQVYPEYGDLEERVAQYAGVKNGQAMVTNGGDQGIDVICRAYLSEGDKVIIPYPEFAMHYQSAGIQGAEILEPKYKEEGKLPLEDILELMDDKKVKLIIFSNPNNPTGIPTTIEDVEKILKKAKEKDIALLHDEAYFEFSGITARDLVEKYDNLYIVRTFAKAFGLVSSRVGYVISQENNIQELLKIRGPYDVNMFAKIGVLAALEDLSYMEGYIREVMGESKPRLERFLKEKGIFFYPSQANYLLLKLPNAEQTIEGLKSKGILVRPKKSPDGEMCLRVSIGTAEDTAKFIEAFEGLL